MKQFNLTVGQVSLISWRSFLKKIKSTRVDYGEHLRLNVMVAYPVFIGANPDQEIGMEDTTTYERREHIVSSNHPAIPKLMLAQALADYTKHGNSSALNRPISGPDAFHHLIEEVCVEAAMEFMEPDTVVALGNRRFLITTIGEWRRWVSRDFAYSVITSSRIFPVYEMPVTVDQQVKRWGNTILEILNQEPNPTKDAAVKFLEKLDREGGSIAVR